MDGKPTLTSVIKKDRKVFVFGKNLKEWAKEVTIICRRCGNVEIVNEDSLCDLWQLCSNCARMDIEAGRLKVYHR